MTFWTSTHERLSPSRAVRRTAADASGPLSSGAVLRLLADSTDFRAWFTSMLLQDAPDAFRWETPALSLETLSRPFECVLIDDPRLQRTAEPLAFATYFQGRHAETYALSVPNLGCTSELIVPRGIASPATYVHLASFLRGAPASQIDALWRCAAETVLRDLSDRPLWLSTAGAGVAWLHVRVDRVPKYYWHRPYAED
jgi:hypothetical protein